MKVSVIVPVYNGEKYLRECLDSICNQTLLDIEIICVDDGSTDSSLEILREYQSKDDRFQIYTQENRYAGVARNLGKSHATGEYLVFWDCDDFFDPQALEKLYQKAKSVDADVCVCGGNRYFESKQKSYPWPPYLNPKKVPSGETFNRFNNQEHYLDFTNVAAWNKLFKRAYIERLGLNFQPVRNGNDVYFTVNAIGLADRITILDEKLINYRVNLDSGLVCSQDAAPLAPIQTWISAAENLEKFDGFGERTFANRALDIMIYMFQHFKSWEPFCIALDALKEYGLKKLHIFPQEEGYYYSAWAGNCVQHFYQDTPEQFAVFLSNSMYMQKDVAVAERRGMSYELSKQKKECKQLTRELQTAYQKQKETDKQLQMAYKKQEETDKKLKETDRQLQEVSRKLEEESKKQEAMSKKLQETRSSWSFKIGKALVWIPGKIKRLI
ncbi:MAG: glycosyltransferase [Lachnospiraceae bacterium]|nr:glycosyltransferase [Lachnospiraceae bacterium]